MSEESTGDISAAGTLGSRNNLEETDTDEMETGYPDRQRAASRRGGGTPQTAVRASHTNPAGGGGLPSSACYWHKARRWRGRPWTDRVRPQCAVGRKGGGWGATISVSYPRAASRWGGGGLTPDQQQATPACSRQEGERDPLTSNKGGRGGSRPEVHAHSTQAARAK